MTDTSDTCCGCDCGCLVPLTEGNEMALEIGRAGEAPEPWESDDRLPVLLLICANCYVGAHKQAVA